jgi:putative transposase
MPAPYPLDLRRKIVRAYDNKEGSIRELAKRFAIAAGTVENYLRLARTTGSVAPRPHGGGPRPRISPEQALELQRLTRERPDVTLSELALALAARHHITVSLGTITRALQRARCLTRTSA